MDDDFLYNLRADPPPALATGLKQRLARNERREQQMRLTWLTAAATLLVLLGLVLPGRSHSSAAPHSLAAGEIHPEHAVIRVLAYTPDVLNPCAICRQDSAIRATVVSHHNAQVR